MRRLPSLAILILMLLICSGETAAQRKPTKPRKPQPAQPVQPAQPAEPTPPPPPVIKAPETPLSVEAMERLQAVIETGMGNITLEFYPKSAPNHVRQFVWLAQNGYFDGMSFSRVIPKYIVQSGNPSSWQPDNSNQQKRFEIPKLTAEYDTNLKHERGILSMARPNDDRNGGTSHFFICTLKFSSLDGNYSIFGHVVSGLDVIDAIAAVPIAEGTPDQPRDRIHITRVVIQEKAGEKPVEKPAEPATNQSTPQPNK